MRQVVRFLERDATVPDIPSDFDPEVNALLSQGWGTSCSLLPPSSATVSLGPVCSADSVLQCGP